MVFRLYAAPTDGSALFTEPQTVAVNDGEFNVVLGSSAALNLPFDVPYFLGVSVDADPEMTPRRAVTASAYAFRAGVADALAPSATVARGQITGSIAGSQIAGSITSTTLPAANITGTIGTAQIANNAVTQAKLSPTTGAAAGKVLGTDGTNLVWQAAASGGGVTSVGASSPLASSGGSTPNISLTGTVPVANGGTGAAALASNGILLGQGTNPVTTIAAGTPGQVLTATAGAPTWTSSPSPTGNLTLNQSTSASVGNIFKGSVPFIHNFPDAGNNTFIGGDAGNFTTTGTGNVGAGTVTLRANTTGSNNVAVGSFTLDLNTTGTANTALGTLALDVNVGGSNNTAVGMSALSNFTSGVGNIAIGKSAGVNLTTGSNNIDIGNSGVAGESNTIRIGDPGAHTKTILAGNVGIGTPTPDAKLRVDLTAGAPGPVAWISGPESQLVLQGVGGAGAMAILDFQTYPTVGGALRQTGSIRSIDTGAFGGHMAFFTKASGAETNPFSERMRITDDGNVGVGTSTPTKARLQISGVGPGTSLGADRKSVV